MRIRVFTIVVIVLLAITGTVAYTYIAAPDSAKKPSAEEVANIFLEAFANNDFERMRTYSTAETEELINTMESFTPAGTPVTKPEKASNCQETKKDVTTCDTCCSEDGKSSTITLHRIDGDWLVHMEK